MENLRRGFSSKTKKSGAAAMKVTGKALPGRHPLPEETPEQTLAALQTFLSA